MAKKQIKNTQYTGKTSRVSRKKTEIGHIGRSTSSIFQTSLATDEYLNTLKWPNFVSIYEKMKRSDAQIKAMLLTLELPLRSTQWYIEPYDDSSQAKNIADLIEENLFEGQPNGMTTHWDDMLRNICTMFAFGFSIFEKVYEVRKDGFLKWRKFAPRPQSTIYDFKYDETGGPAGIVQTLYNQAYANVDIPIDKLLVFSHRAENGDIRGQSALRAAYKHWSIKDFLYKIINIGIERNYVGTPTIKLPPGATPEDVTEAKALVTTLRSSDLGGALIPDGFLLEVFEGKRTMQDVMPYLQHQDLMIVRSVLAQFINLGSSDVGSYALSEDQSDMFLMLLNAEAKYICNVFNTHAIPQLVRYNFNSDLFPKLCFKPLGGNDNKLFETLKLLVDGNLIIPDTGIEEWLRDMLELPEKKEDEMYGNQQPEQEQKNKDDEGKTIEPSKEKDGDINNSKTDGGEEQVEKGEDKIKKEDKEAKEKVKKLSDSSLETPFWRKPKPEEEGINFKEIDNSITKLENSFKDNGKNIITKIIKDLSSKAQTTELSELSKIQVKYKKELTLFVLDHLERSYNLGVQTQTNGEEIKINMNEFKAQASLVANNIAERVKSRYLFNYMANLSDNNLSKAAKAAERVMLNAD